MQLFNKNKGKTDNSPNPEDNDKKTYEIKKKTKIGFKFKKEKNPPNEISNIKQQEKNDNYQRINEINKEIDGIKNENSQSNFNDIIKEENDNINDEPEIKQEPVKDLKKEIKTDKDKEKKDTKTQWPSTKKRRLITKDMKGKPVYLEDTGEKLGIVFDMIYDTDKKLVGYKIKDYKSQSILSFPCDQFDEDKDGLIFVQNWYMNAVKTLERLEFKERISPELTTLIGDETITEEELYNIFVKHDDQMVNYIDEAISLRDLVSQRLHFLEKKRLSLKDKLMDLTEKRLIKDIDRREFSELVTEHRHKVNVLDVNIKKCKDLLKRLNNTSFGKLGKDVQTNNKVFKDKDNDFETFDNKPDDKGFVFTEEIENPYKQKYIDIKEKYNALQENYNELKLAVEKLISKDEI